MSKGTKKKRIPLIYSLPKTSGLFLYLPQNEVIILKVIKTSPNVSI